MAGVGRHGLCGGPDGSQALAGPRADGRPPGDVADAAAIVTIGLPDRTATGRNCFHLEGLPPTGSARAMSPSSDSPAPDRPAATDPYSYFAVRGVSREALRDFFEAEVERSVRSDRVEGSPIAELYRLLGLDWMVALVALLGGTESYAPWSADAAVGKCRRYQPSCASCSSSTMAAAGSRPLH